MLQFVDIVQVSRLLILWKQMEIDTIHILNLILRWIEDPFCYDLNYCMHNSNAASCNYKCHGGNGIVAHQSSRSLETFLIGPLKRNEITSQLRSVPHNALVIQLLQNSKL